MSTRQESETRRRPAAVPDFRTDLILIFLLFGWAFLVNRKFRISGLYMDDLYMWSCWGEQSFREYVFPVGSTRFRPVYWLAAWLELLIVGNHITWIVPINILLNALLASFLYAFAARLSKSRATGFVAGMLFLSSHFAYYQIGQLLGLMETMGIFFAAAQCLFLYRYLREEGNGGRNLGAALLFYLLNCFTHERYMVLLPMFFYCLLIKKEKKVSRWLLPLLLFALMLFARRAAIGTLSPAGTGGTNVADTATRGSILTNFLVELLYAAGVNAGPDYLCGLPWQNTPFCVKILVLLWNLLLLALLCLVLSGLRCGKRYGVSWGRVLGDAVFFLGFLIGTAVSSAVTIRVEMRWVYVVYVFWLLLLCCLIGLRRTVLLRRNEDPEAEHRYEISERFPLAFFAASAVLCVLVQLCYRSCSGNIYLFPNQKRYNSLADVTYGKYGRDILGKKIYIIGNFYEMSDFTAETFFKTFDPERTGQGTEVRHVDSVLDFGQVTDDMIILKEDAPHDLFTDVTDLVRDLKLTVVSGYYTQDGWMDENAHLRIMTGAGGDIAMHVMYPGNLRGDEWIRVTENGEPAVTYLLKSNEADFVIPAAPQQIVDLTFSTNFYVENALEQRGTDRLAMIVNFTAE